MEQLLVKLITLVSQRMPDLEVVDEDYGQIEMLDQENQDSYPLTFPAVLIDASSVEWTTTGQLSQKGTATVRVRLAIDCYDDTHAGSGTTALIADRMKRAHKLHKILQGYGVGQNSNLMRSTSRYYTANHGIKVYESTYTCTVTEDVADEQFSTTLKPKITVQR